ncbi:MAG: hypothetical protein Kow0029_10020 [Candidatus Rifleibacteriota bacterium]
MQIFKHIGIAFAVVFISLCLSGKSLAIDLDRQFEQKLDQPMLQSLIENCGKERAIFIEYDSKANPLVFYLRFDKTKNKFVLRGNFPELAEKKLDFSSLKAQITTFTGQKKNLEPLYTYGSALHWTFKSPFNTEPADIVYVPHQLREKPNKCFISDLGYMEIHFQLQSENVQSLISQLLASFSNGKIRLAKQVAYNRYYLFKDNFFGPVHRFSENSLSASQHYARFLPLHKLTMNKRISNWKMKEKLDRELLFNIMREDDYLFSQDQRLKLGLVPAYVKLNLERIPETDIGSGQNQFVFLSSGPGINYFDDPWKSPRKNLPGPRLLFDKSVYVKDRIQIFPTFSIEPEENGEARLQVINEFQKFNSSSPYKYQREPLWCEMLQRRKLTDLIENELCKYGLINDSEDLRPGFVLAGKTFKGNIVNNEIRIMDAISLRSMMKAVIVPPGQAIPYQNSYIQAFRNSSPHWQYNCANHFTDLFIEASTPDDKGFRIAWLKFHLKRSNPTLYRLLIAAKKAKCAKAEKLLAEKIAALVQHEGAKFFDTAFARHFSKMEIEKLVAWCDYLEAYRLKNENAGKLLSSFIEKNRMPEEAAK